MKRKPIDVPASSELPQDEQQAPERGAQEISPGEREAERQRQQDQNPSGTAEGRDVPPADVDNGVRGRKSPWMGGG